MKRFRNNTTKVYIPEREELLQTLHGGLLVLLLLSVSITFLTMVYSYKDSKARYLYFLFTYGSAISNFLVGFVIFYYFCVKRSDLQKLLKDTFVGVKERRQGKHGSGDQMESRFFVEHDSNARCDDDEEADEREMFDDVDDGECGEDVAVADALVEHEVEKARVQIRGSEDEEALKMHDQSATEAGDRNHHHHKLQTPFVQSEISENEHFSNAPNSIGECSLVSSGKRNKPAAKPIELPTNLKNFVPENWRPARRRMNKGASYYPYYVSDNAPISASLAYSSKSSSLASTTVSGVPLYKNNHTPQHANGGIGPSPVAFHSQPPHLPPNVPIRLAPPPPSYVAVMAGNTFHPPVINEIDTDPIGSENETGSMVNPEETDLVESETGLMRESESEIDEAPKVAVAPNLYIPMPHVSIKQFILRNETSV